MRLALATDLGDHAEGPFLTGLALAMRAQTPLHLLHVAQEGEPPADWSRLPTVRQVLVRWGRLEREASYTAFEALGLQVVPHERVVSTGPGVGVARAAYELAPDLLILGTAARTGPGRLLWPSVAEAVVRQRWGASLILAPGRSLIDETGAVKIRRVLVPLAAEPDPHRAIVALARVLGGLRLEPLELTLLHVGDAGELPAVGLPTHAGWEFRVEQRQGELLPQLIDAAQRADLVVMPTQGHDSWADDLLGSTTERLLRQAGRPLLALHLT